MPNQCVSFGGAMQTCTPLHQQLPPGTKWGVRQHEAAGAGAQAVGAGGGTHSCIAQPLRLEGFKPVVQLLR